MVIHRLSPLCNPQDYPCLECQNHLTLCDVIIPSEMTFTWSQFLTFCSWSDLNILTWRSVGCRFIYVFLGAGAITCFVSLTGHIAAELSNGFCLSCVSYSNVSNASCNAERKGSFVDLGTCNCAL